MALPNKTSVFNLIDSHKHPNFNAFRGYKRRMGFVPGARNKIFKSYHRRDDLTSGDEADAEIDDDFEKRDENFDRSCCSSKHQQVPDFSSGTDDQEELDPPFSTRQGNFIDL